MDHMTHQQWLYVTEQDPDASYTIEERQQLNAAVMTGLAAAGAVILGGEVVAACMASGTCSGVAGLVGTTAGLSDLGVEDMSPVGKITKNTSKAIDAARDAIQKSKKKLSATPTKENKGGSIEGPQQSKSKNREDSATNSNCVCGAGRCFVAGTLISTIDGLKPIEDIQLGDLVAARDENNSSGEVSWKPVTELFFNDDDRTTNLVTLEDAAGEQELYEVTDNHPFYIDGRGWVDVDHLEPGMQVPSSKGGLLTIITIEVRNSSPVTYNIEVDEFHTYFVGGFGAWVHNQNNPNCSKVCGKGKSQADDGLEGTVGRYEDLRKKTAKTKYTPDHQPSARSLVDDYERKVGRKATKGEIAEINKKGGCVVIKRCTHESSSETYGGRNRSKDESGRRKYERDADDPDAAIDSNMDALSDTLKSKDGWSQGKIDAVKEQLKKQSKGR